MCLKTWVKRNCAIFFLRSVKRKVRFVISEFCLSAHRPHLITFETFCTFLWSSVGKPCRSVWPRRHTVDTIPSTIPKVGQSNFWDECKVRNSHLGPLYILYADISWSCKELQMKPFLWEKKTKYRRGGRLKVRICILLYGDGPCSDALWHMKFGTVKDHGHTSSFTWVIIFFNEVFKYGIGTIFRDHAGTNAKPLCAEMLNVWKVSGSRRGSTWPRGYTPCWHVYTNKTRVMPFIATKSVACMSTSWLLGNVYTAVMQGQKRDPDTLKLGLVG
jgi:hypothetical protein